MKQRKDKGRSPAESHDHHPGKSEDQSSPGDLKHNQGSTIDQSFPAGSNNASIGSFRTVDEAIVELPIGFIQNYQIIPDYRDQTNSKFPIVVQSEASCHCIDGWNLIEEAKSADQSVIRCHVFHIENDSGTEIAIRKVAIRTMPRGGTCSYAERVRNATILFNMLLTSSENPVVFSHGGSRRGATYIQNTEDNIRTLLVNRLGKSPVTINKYLNHGEFINDETMQELINADVEKGFFEANQVQKRRLIDRLKADQIPDDDITDTVSQLVLSLLNDYRQADPVEISGGQSDQEEVSAEENQPEQIEASASTAGISEFKHWSGNENSEADAPATEEGISQRIKVIGSLLLQTAENTELTIQERVEEYTLQNFKLSRLIQGLIHLMNENGIKGEDQG